MPVAGERAHLGLGAAAGGQGARVARLGPQDPLGRPDRVGVLAVAAPGAGDGERERRVRPRRLVLLGQRFNLTWLTVR